MTGDDRRILTNPDQTVVVAENGPMRLVIRAWYNGKFQADQAFGAAEQAFTCLEQVARYHQQLRSVSTDEETSQLPDICRTMIDSVKAINTPDLTPMASVAGAIADAVADHLLAAIIEKHGRHGSIKVIIDNGGDLAIRLSGQETAKVGLRTDLNTSDLSHTMALDSTSLSWGVNTSGLGGRSFTRGIASAVTAVARTSAIADAAATALANACFYPDPGIVQVPAQTLDPNTDIPKIPVTTTVARMPETVVKKAVSASLNIAQGLVDQGLIRGAFIACQGMTARTIKENAFTIKKREAPDY